MFCKGSSARSAKDRQVAWRARTRHFKTHRQTANTKPEFIKSKSDTFKVIYCTSGRKMPPIDKKLVAARKSAEMLGENYLRHLERNIPKAGRGTTRNMITKLKNLSPKKRNTAFTSAEGTLISCFANLGGARGDIILGAASDFLKDKYSTENFNHGKLIDPLTHHVADVNNNDTINADHVRDQRYHLQAIADVLEMIAAMKIHEIQMRKAYPKAYRVVAKFDGPLFRPGNPIARAAYVLRNIINYGVLEGDLA